MLMYFGECLKRIVLRNDSMAINCQNFQKLHAYMDQLLSLLRAMMGKEQLPLAEYSMQREYE